MTSSLSRNRTTAGVLFGVTSSVAFGAGGPFAKALITAGFSPLQAVWVRVIGTVVVLVAICLVMRQPGRWATMVRYKWQILVYGLVAVAACQSLYFVAASRLPVGIAILLEFTGPVLVVGWEKLVRRAHVARESAIGVGVAMLGLSVVVQIWSGLHLDAIGIVAGLGAAAGNATFFLLVDRLSGAVDPLTLTTGGMTVGLVVLTPLAAPWSAPWHVLGASVPLGSHHVPGWTLAAFVVLISTILSYLTGAAAIQRLSATVASGLAYVEPASVTVIAWLTLGERLSAPQIVGGVIVLGGAYLAQRGIEHTTVSEPDSARSILGTTVGTEPLIP